MKTIFKKDKYKPDTQPQRSFTAYIIKGNRQVITRDVNASKRFRVEQETYVIRDDCIFLKNIDGIFKSVSYYREGNPNPYDFKTDNKGISPKDLDRLFAEDFYNIIVNIAPDRKTIYILLMNFINLALIISFVMGVIFDTFIF